MADSFRKIQSLFHLLSIKITTMRVFKNIVTVIATGLIISGLFAFAATNQENASINQNVAGLYLCTQPEGSIIMHIYADGNLTLELSEEFPGNNNFQESFSNPLGRWENVGKQTLRATTLDIVLDDQGLFKGVGVAENTIRFDDQFQTAVVDCFGELYAPGVDPYASGAKPIPNSKFSCEEMRFSRIRVKGK